MKKHGICAITNPKGGIEIVDNGGKYNVLFVGNSITRHEPKSAIGWEHDWGMAASVKDKDIKLFFIYARKY